MSFIFQKKIDSTTVNFHHTTAPHCHCYFDNHQLSFFSGLHLELPYIDFANFCFYPNLSSKFQPWRYVFTNRYLTKKTIQAVRLNFAQQQSYYQNIFASKCASKFGDILTYKKRRNTKFCIQQKNSFMFLSRKLTKFAYSFIW